VTLDVNTSDVGAAEVVQGGVKTTYMRPLPPAPPFVLEAQLLFPLPPPPGAEPFTPARSLVTLQLLLYPPFPPGKVPVPPVPPAPEQVANAFPPLPVEPPAPPPVPVLPLMSLPALPLPPLRTVPEPVFAPAPPAAAIPS